MVVHIARHNRHDSTNFLGKPYEIDRCKAVLRKLQLRRVLQVARVCVRIARRFPLQIGTDVSGSHGGAKKTRLNVVLVPHQAAITQHLGKMSGPSRPMVQMKAWVAP